MKETEEQLRERLTNILNKHLGWRTRLRWFFHPRRKKLAVDLLVNQAKYMDCHKDEIPKIDTTGMTPTDILFDTIARTLPSYTFVQEEKTDE